MWGEKIYLIHHLNKLLPYNRAWIKYVMYKGTVLRIEDCEYPVWNFCTGDNRGSMWCWICQRYCNWWCEDCKWEWLSVTRGTVTLPYSTCRSEWVTWTDMPVQYLDNSCAHYCIYIFKLTFPVCTAEWHGPQGDYLCHYTSLFFF